MAVCELEARALPQQLVEDVALAGAGPPCHCYDAHRGADGAQARERLLPALHQPGVWVVGDELQRCWGTIWVHHVCDGAHAVWFEKVQQLLCCETCGGVSGAQTAAAVAEEEKPGWHRRGC